MDIQQYLAVELVTDVTHIASKFHRFHRWLFTFNPFGVETNTEGVKRE
jgi:hypothetical protein